MARKKPHEDHVNHEAWAIPYGDLITLLLAFFVVMYAVSSVNEGKYRVMAEALSEAFGGPPRSIQPIQVGKIQKANDPGPNPVQSPQKQIVPAMGGGMRALSRVGMPPRPDQANIDAQNQKNFQLNGQASAQLQTIRNEISTALVELIEMDLVVVRRTPFTLEIEIKTDILFSSGSAALTDKAKPVIQQLADILEPHENPIRIEGHTDDVPISTLVYPSNWELSAARATSVVHQFIERGVAPVRLSVQGYGEFQPVGDNKTADGRNLNRRVVMVVMPSEAAGEIAAELAEFDSPNNETPVTAPGSGATATPAEATP